MQKERLLLQIAGVTRLKNKTVTAAAEETKRRQEAECALEACVSRMGAVMKQHTAVVASKEGISQSLAIERSTAATLAKRCTKLNEALAAEVRRRTLAEAALERSDADLAAVRDAWSASGRCGACGH